MASTHPRHAPSAAELARRCRSAGLKATPQRLAIFAALLASREHPSPEQLYSQVSRSLPSISLATIYKTLDSLERVGLVSQVAVPSEVRRYDANLAPHQHLVCEACSRIIDISVPAWQGFSLPEELAGFVPRQLKVQVLGLCERCAREESSEDPINSSAAGAVEHAQSSGFNQPN